MEQLPIQHDFFEPIIPLILAMGPLNWVEIGLADDLVIDKEVILQYFENTAEIGKQRTDFTSKPKSILRGYLKNNDLWQWLYQKWLYTTPRWEYFEYEARGSKQREHLPHGEAIRKYLKGTQKFESEESFERRKAYYRDGQKPAELPASKK